MRMTSRRVLMTGLIVSAYANAILAPAATTAGASFTPDDPSDTSIPLPDGAPFGASFAARSFPPSPIHATTAPPGTGASVAHLPSATVQRGELGHPALSSARVRI